MPITRRWLDPKTVELSNDVPQAYQSGTGASPNPQRPEVDPQQPAPPTRLGEPSTPVNRLGAARQPEMAYLEERERAELDERQMAMREGKAKEFGARFGDAAVQELSPREMRAQERLEGRRERMDDYIREHPGFTVNEDGGIDANDITDEEAREMKRRMGARDRAEKVVRRYAPRERGR